MECKDSGYLGFKHDKECSRDVMEKGALKAKDATSSESHTHRKCITKQELGGIFEATGKC